MTYDLTGKRIWVAGHRGMVGEIARQLVAARIAARVDDVSEGFGTIGDTR